jgi:hypothetical protein
MASAACGRARARMVREPSQRIGIGDMRANLLTFARERLADASWPLRP